MNDTILLMGLSIQEHGRHKKEPDERPQESSEEVSYVGGIASSSYVMVKDLLGEVKDNNGVPYIVDGKLNRDISLDTGTVERCTIFSGSFNLMLAALETVSTIRFIRQKWTQY